MALAETMARAEPLFGVTKSLGGKAWALSAADDRVAGEIARLTGAPDALARLLCARGVTPQDAGKFLDPRLRDFFPDPASFKGMTEAARLIWDAVQGGRRIAIFADYDVDGATSAAQLGLWLRALGHEPLVYIPDRIEEGYGPTAAAFETLKGRGAELIVTLDCGAVSVEPIAAANASGLPVVVIDHHMMTGVPPEAAALVNPNQPGCESGCGHMAAAGVVFVLLAALNREGVARGRFSRESAPDLMDFADLAALGTVCDVVALTGCNRAIVAQGLKVMSRWARPGLKALAEVAGASGPATPYHAGFLLGPRINAGGRVGKSDLGVRLLMAADAAEAWTIAHDLDALNAERRAIEADVLAEAAAQIERLDAIDDRCVLIASGEHWHPGVIGIAAGRLKERFNRPSIVIGIDPETGLGKGSGRSVTGVDLGSAISAARSAGILIAGGGHKMAAGLTVAADRIEDLHAFLAERLAPEWVAAEAARTLTLDAVLSPSAVSFEFCERMGRAAPYGMGHPEPRFGFPDVRLVFSQRVGADHVRFTFEGEGGGRVEGICFRCADEPIGQALLTGGEGPWHAAGKLRAEDNRFGRRAQLHLEDLTPAR